MKTLAHRRARRVGIAALLACLALALAACGSGGSGASEPDKVKVGLVMKSLSNEFFKQMQEGAEEYAATRTADFDFQAVGMADERDFAAQVSAVDTFIADDFDIIVVAPADSQAMVVPIKRAMDAGITVINIDVPLDEQAMTEAGIDLPFFGPDNTEGAREVGDLLGQQIGRGGKVFILDGNPEALNGQQRRTGFDAAVEAHGLQVLESDTAHWETGEANTLVANWLTAHPDVQGIMAANDSMALGAVSALEAAGRSDVKVVGFDNIPAVTSLVEQGKVLGTVEQYGADMAVFGIEYGLRTRAGETFQGWTKTPIKLIDATTAAS